MRAQREAENEAALQKFVDKITFKNDMLDYNFLKERYRRMSALKKQSAK